MVRIRPPNSLVNRNAMFFDDTYLSYKARISYSLLSSKDFNETAAFMKKTRILMTSTELAAYIIKPENYKYAFVARIMNNIVGILLFTDLDTEVFINHLYVSPTHRFKGIGSSLIKELKAFMPQKTLSYIDTSNNYMPWMDTLDTSKKAEVMNRLGSFYK
nr:GNAT family N-acetyltransferase [Legionella brunensis]